MGKIHEKNRLYSLLKFYVDPNTRSSYRRMETKGLENIPKTGSIILAPNHSNALMDALNVLQSHDGPTVFGARADMFNSPVLAKIMTFLRILPMVRERDGLHNVIRNKGTMDVISEVLGDHVPYCMFSEGTHRTMHSLLPIKKGIFRTAMTALESNPDNQISIVPVGIEYSDYFRYRGDCVMEFGEPMDFGSFMKGCDGLGLAEVYRKLGEELSGRISKLITFIPDDDLYDGKWALVRILGVGAKGKPSQIKALDRGNAAAIESALQNNQDGTIALLDEAKSFDGLRHVKHISIHSFGHGTATVLARTLAWLVTLPFFLVSALLTLPVWMTNTVICAKVEDRAFHNSVRAVVKMLVSPLTLIIWAVIAFCTMPWWAALALCVYYLPSCRIFYDYREFSRVLLSDWMLMISGKELKSRFAAIKESFKKLI